MIIGIDPDIEKSGIAFFVGDELQLKCLSFYEIISYAEVHAGEYGYKDHYFIEAGWLNKKSSWHAAQNKQIAAAIGRKVGENHATGKLLVECLRAIGHEVTEVKPTRTKLNDKQFKAATGYEGRTNQEQRDAAMLIWHLRNA